MLEGKLIALEGIDGAGTTTQLSLLSSALQQCGYMTYCTNEPSTGWIGKAIRTALTGQTACSEELFALLFAADRLHHVQQEIAPQQQQGKVVLTDRYLLSSLVYQGSKLPLDWIEQINRYAQPADITIFVAVSAETAAQRRSQRPGEPEYFESLARQQQVIARYDELIAQLHPCLGQLVLINGEQSKAQVTAAMVEQLGANLGQDFISRVVPGAP